MAEERRRPLLRRLRSPGAIRLRTTAAAVLVVGVALALAAVATVTLLERSMAEHVRDTAFSRAEDIAGDLARVARSDRIATHHELDEFVQAVGEGGEILAASANVAGLPPLVRLRGGASGILPSVPFEDGPFLVVAVPASVRGRPATVVVGHSYETVSEARRAVTGALGLLMPLLVLVVGAVTWRVVGRALAPVEAIREEVDAISGSELHRRVPVPPGDDELSRLARTMNRMLERLQAARARERRFVSDASHELRSPVASIRQHAEVALAHPEATDVADLAGVVLEEDLRLQRMVEDLLLLARIDEGTLKVASEPVDLDDLVLEEASRLRSSTGLRIQTRGVSAGRVLGDRDRLERLLRNLTENAVRHARTTVALSLREEDDAVVMDVDDDGEGIPEVDRERVFERFVRLQEARDRDSGGSGLGLAIVREIAALHGGRVSVEDGPLGGARFEVRLPAHRP
ncbi:MAG TPA: ATP-binding protein [Actinomycetota bacterium]|nr:ATP-binding protein [Actinomycetota bacterium]